MVTFQTALYKVKYLDSQFGWDYDELLVESRIHEEPWKAPYKIKAIKESQSELEARREELRLKKQISRKYLEWLIAGKW